MSKEKSVVSRKRVREILREARSLMNDNGAHWIKNRMSRRRANGEMCYCSLGAINAVTVNYHERFAAKEALVRHGLNGKTSGSSSFYRQKDEIESSIFAFNDRSSTSWRDVDRVFRTAVHKLR